MASESYRASDHGEWADAGLDGVQDAHEISYCNQEEDGADQLRGEWFIADDDRRTIVYGTFGNCNSPGASHYTYAEVYDDEGEYRAALAEWESKPEYLNVQDDDEGRPEWSVVVGNIGTLFIGEDGDAARECYEQYKRLSQDGCGRAAGEEVSLFCNGDIVEEYTPEAS
jgi:hypothetical protein